MFKSRRNNRLDRIGKSQKIQNRQINRGANTVLLYPINRTATPSFLKNPITHPQKRKRLQALTIHSVANTPQMNPNQDMSRL